MIYDRFSVFLAVSVTCLGLASGTSSSFTYRGKNYNPLISTAVAETIGATTLGDFLSLSQLTTELWEWHQNIIKNLVVRLS